jgi:predicted YcjX-like family ATPase
VKAKGGVMKAKVKRKPMSKREAVARYEAGQQANELNRKYYDAHREELLKKFRNKYIAISDRQVVAFDKDRNNLLDRVMEDYGDVPVFFTQVSLKPRVVHIPSYALVRSARLA